MTRLFLTIYFNLNFLNFFFKKSSEFFSLIVDLLFADQTSIDIRYICSFFYADSGMFDSTTDFHIKNDKWNKKGKERSGYFRQKNS